jgi:uncharacterized membrane protein YfcA
MEFLGLVLIGCLVGLTTVLFGFGGGFVTVPIITLVDADLGHDTARVAAATSALVMLVNAIVATVSTKRSTLAHLKGRWWLLGLLGWAGDLGAFAGRFAPEALLQWGFVAYIAATAIDLLARPGFFRRKPAVVDEVGEVSEGGRGIAAVWGVPIGGLASFLGVGGSVMTVPMMRRSGATMTVATTLANPLTLVIMSSGRARDDTDPGGDRCPGHRRITRPGGGRGAAHRWTADHRVPAPPGAEDPRDPPRLGLFRAAHRGRSSRRRGVRWSSSEAQSGTQLSQRCLRRMGGRPK